MEYLGKISDRVQKDIELILDITSHIDAPIQIDPRGMLLLLSKVYLELVKFHPNAKKAQTCALETHIFQFQKEGI